MIIKHANPLGGDADRHHDSHWYNKVVPQGNLTQMWKTHGGSRSENDLLSWVNTTSIFAWRRIQRNVHGNVQRDAIVRHGNVALRWITTPLGSAKRLPAATARSAPASYHVVARGHQLGKNLDCVAAAKPPYHHFHSDNPKWSSNGP